MTVLDPKFAETVERLTGDHPPRVWSLIVTLFGDLAQGAGEELSGTLLTRIMGLAGIRPEAMRVALHRLRRDGWIESRKSGREGFYGLTASGRAQSAAASPVIYRAEPPRSGPWHVLVAEQPEALDAVVNADAYVPLGPATYLGKGPPPTGLTGLLAFEATGFRAPGDAPGRLIPQDLQDLTARLTTAVEDLAALDPAQMSPLEIATLRTLTVHGWRRIALRLPDLPPELLPEGWKGEACRAAVHRLLGRLDRPEIANLEALVRTG